jgi:hypothetical protein
MRSCCLLHDEEGEHEQAGGSEYTTVFYIVLASSRCHVPVRIVV